jgi:hypothetical protein
MYRTLRHRNSVLETIVRTARAFFRFQPGDSGESALRTSLLGLQIFLILLETSGLYGAAEQSGREVVVVYNTRIPESKGVAEHYAELRGVPTNQIFGFELSTNEDFSRTAFRDTLQRPLAKKLEQNKLWHISSKVMPASSNRAQHVEWKVEQSKIRYLVLCYGVPLHIAKDPNLKEKAAESLRAELQRNEAAVDSELSLLPMIEEKLPLAGPLNNPAYTTTNVALLHPTNGLLLVTRLDGPRRASREAWWIRPLKPKPPAFGAGPTSICAGSPRGR